MFVREMSGHADLYSAVVAVVPDVAVVAVVVSAAAVSAGTVLWWALKMLLAAMIAPNESIEPELPAHVLEDDDSIYARCYGLPQHPIVTREKSGQLSVQAVEVANTAERARAPRMRRSKRYPCLAIYASLL